MGHFIQAYDEGDAFFFIAVRRTTSQNPTSQQPAKAQQGEHCRQGPPASSQRPGGPGPSAISPLGERDPKQQPESLRSFRMAWERPSKGKKRGCRPRWGAQCPLVRVEFYCVSRREPPLRIWNIL